MPVGTSPAAKCAEGSAAEALSVAESDHATASAALTQAKREEAIVEEQAASAGSELREVIAEQHRKEGSSAPESASAQAEMNAKVQTARVKLHATMQKLKAARSLTVSAEQAAHDTHEHRVNRPRGSGPAHLEGRAVCGHGARCDNRGAVRAVRRSHSNPGPTPASLENIAAQLRSQGPPAV